MKLAAMTAFARPRAGRAWPGAVLDTITSRGFLVSAATLLLALFLGVATPIYVSLMGTSIPKLMALPAVMVLGLLLLYDKRVLLILILLVRAVGDPILESTKISLGGTQLGVGVGINLVIILIAALFTLERPKEFPRQLATAWWPFMLIIMIGFVVTPNKADGVRLVMATLSYFAIFIIGTYMVRSREDFKFALKVVISSSILVSLYAFVDIGLHARDSSFRLVSAFTHANILAFYLTLIISLLLYVLKSPTFALRQSQRLGLSAYLVLQLALLLLTQTRSAWIACGAIFAIYAIMFERKYLLYLLLMPLVAALIPSVRERILDLAGGNEVYTYAKLNSFAWRMVLWEAGLRWMAPSHYLFGYGVEAFRFHSQTFFTMAAGIDWSPHNLLVQLIFDIGVVGLCTYLFVFWRVIGRLKNLVTVDRLAAVLLIATMIAHLIVSTSDNIYAYLIFNWYFWFTIGAACSLAPLKAKVVKPFVAAPPGGYAVGHTARH
ncbi:O-antigen ligase family protein [Oxalobacteraceae bacterium OTU3CINTB1]|nr:O-antigen ligase family protein [Oxalobacteraceae bacterium OTU3CINTB1]